MLRFIFVLLNKITEEIHFYDPNSEEEYVLQEGDTVTFNGQPWLVDRVIKYDLVERTASVVEGYKR